MDILRYAAGSPITPPDIECSECIHFGASPWTHSDSRDFTGRRVTIGTGIFLKSAVMAQAVGTPALVLGAWIVAGLIAIFGALSFTELGALPPQAGGEYVYLRAAFGEVPGFLYVFNSFIVGGASIFRIRRGGLPG